MEVKQSSIEGAGLGVFATKAIESGAWFGPYRGKKVRADIPMNPGLDTSYMWEVNKILLDITNFSVYKEQVYFQSMKCAESNIHPSEACCRNMLA
jgi:hypothetical protein